MATKGACSVHGVAKGGSSQPPLSPTPWVARLRLVPCQGFQHPHGSTALAAHQRLQTSDEPTAQGTNTVSGGEPWG